MAFLPRPTPLKKTFPRNTSKARSHGARPSLCSRIKGWKFFAEADKKIFLILIIFLAAILVGSVAVAYNELFFWATKLARKRYFSNPAIVFFSVPLFFVISAYLCRKFAPNAAGSGPEHVMAALTKLSAPRKKKKDVSEYLSFRILVVKFISSIICIAGGGALGREGPLVQMAASIFLLTGEKLKKFLPSFDIRTWVIAGSAAGVAAAFNTPLAGIVFAIEELSKFHFEKQFFSFKIKAFFAVIVAGVTTQSITGSYVLFDFPVMRFSWGLDIALVLLLISAACGLAAWVLKKTIVRMTAWRNTLSGKQWYLVPVGMGLIVATISFSLGYNTFGAGVFTIQEALASPHAVLTYKDTAGRFINIIASAVSGSAGGLLLPALALGAGIGSVGSLLLTISDARIFVSAGMAAFLGALLNAPLTAAVLVLEVTNQRELILPLFLSTLIASWVFQMCNIPAGGKSPSH